MARKGKVRRAHFAHVSNYECMYASEVALYKAVADMFSQARTVYLPAIELKFPTWSKPDELTPARQADIENVEFSCEAKQYPPDLFLRVDGNRLRIIIDFDEYYTQEELAQLRSDCSMLVYAFPSPQNHEFFTPDNLHRTLTCENDCVRWEYSLLVERWKKRFRQKAVTPPPHGTGYECPIHIGKYKGRYSARWNDCVYCEFNVAESQDCLCLGHLGICSADDFRADPAQLAQRVSAIRARNDADIERQEHAEAVRRAYYHRPALGHAYEEATPSQTERDAEYHRVVAQFKPDAEEPTFDKYGRRWLRCDVCGEVKQDIEMSIYGGKGSQNRGKCSACIRKMS